MKKLTAVALALILLMCLAGCAAGSDSDSIVGTWSTEIDTTPLYEELTEGMDAELETYFTFNCVPYTVSITFREDGTYTMSADEASVDAAVEALVDCMRDGMYKGLEAQFAQTGVGMTVEEALAATNLTIDDLMTGVNAETIFAQILESSTLEGQYEAKDGKLFLSSGTDTAVDEAIYDAYTLDGDTLTLTEHFGNESEEEQAFAAEMYPMVFNRK